jgi:DNA-binding SARP family transcriptional activator
VQRIFQLTKWNVFLMPSDLDRVQGIIDDGERRGDQQTLLNSAYEAVEQARMFEPATRLVQSLATYVRLLTRDGQYEAARSYADEILQIDPTSNAAVEATIALGVCAAYTNQLDEAEQIFHQATELSRKIGYSQGVSRSTQYYSSLVLLTRGQFSLAIALLEEAGHLQEEQGSRHWTNAFLRGFIFQIIGDRLHSREILDDLLLQFEPGTRLAAAYYLLWARQALEEEDLEQANEYLRLGLRVANHLGIMDLNLWFRLALSRYHRLKNEAPIARSWANDVMIQAQRFGSHYFHGLALIERAQANWETGDFECAQSDLEDAIRRLQPLQAAYELARAHYLHALWLRQIDPAGAEAAWETAAQHIISGGYAFILEKEQDKAFPLVAVHARSKTTNIRAKTEKLLSHLAAVPPPPLRIVTLGQFAVWKGRRRIADQSWNRRRAGELFRYLLLQPNRTTGRELILEALWGNHDSGSPSDLLHQATSALRHALEPDLPDKFPSRYLKVEGEQVALHLPPGSVVDFEQFERYLPQAIQTHKIDRLQEALNLYSGELFPSDRYADWSAEKSQTLAELHHRGQLALAVSYLEQGQFYNTITCCRAVLHEDPWNEDAVLYAMQAYTGLQNAPQALLLYREIEKRLKEELDILPRPDLRVLAESIRSR